MTHLPMLPPTLTAQVAAASGLLALLVSLWSQWRMWQVEFGLRPVAAGGGEFMMALLLGLPLLLIALVLLGVGAFRRPWACWSARVAFAIALLPALGLLVLFVRG